MTKPAATKAAARPISAPRPSLPLDPDLDARRAAALSADLRCRKTHARAIVERADGGTGPIVYRCEPCGVASRGTFMHFGVRHAPGSDAEREADEEAEGVEREGFEPGRLWR